MNFVGTREKIGTASAAALVLAAVLIVYLPALHNGFVNWDDGDYVVENAHIRSLNWDFIEWAFSSFHASNWHPLTWISHALDYAIWGMNPFGHHLTSVILHSVNACLVVLLVSALYRLARERMMGKVETSHVPPTARILLVGTIPGILFGLHPLHVESVAWVAERKDVLCALFYLLGLLAYVRYIAIVRGIDTPKTILSFLHRRYYLLSFGSFLLAMMSKPMAVSLPVVLIVMDWYFGRLSDPEARRRAAAEKIPFLLIALVSIILTLLAQSDTIQAEWEYPMSDRILVASRSLFVYIWKMLVPVNLSPFYPYPLQGAVSLSKYGLYPALMVIVSSVAVVAAIRGRRKLWLSLWSYYVVTLFPVLGIVQVGIQSMADRYTYLPSIAPFLLAGLGAAFTLDLVGRTWGRFASKVGLLFIIALLASSVLLLASSTRKQIKIWENGETLWTRALEGEPLNALPAYLNRGSYYWSKGRHEEALEDFNKGISISVWGGGKGFLLRFFNNRALLYVSMGQVDKALDDIAQVERLDPENHKIYALRATIRVQQGLYDAALEDYTRAIEIQPTYDYFNNRAIILATLGRDDEALSDYGKAIGMDPTLPDAYYNRGNLNARLGHYEQARLDYSEAISLSPAPRADYFNNRAFVLKQLGRLDDAQRDVEKARELTSRK